MGRRPNNTTKSGRFMNPADQQRKLERAKELKKNKKQRSAVRHAILKNRDPDDLINQLRKIDDVELESEGPLRISLQEKREKVRKMYRETREYFQKEENAEKMKEVDLKMHGYEAERHRKFQQMAAVKFSQSGNMEDIPLPDGPRVDNAAMTPYLPSYAVQPHERGPRGPPPPRKRVRFGEPRKPPGPPIGMPPDFSDSEDEDGAPLHNDDNFDSVLIPEGLLDDDFPSRRDAPMPIQPPAYPMLNLANAPPLHPSLLPPPPRMPLRMPPPPPIFGRPLPGPEPAVISAAPMVSNPKLPAVESTISAKPELRDLARESARLIPTHLRVKRENQTKKVVQRTNAMGMSAESATKKAAKTTDDAYSDFMKEMEGLL